MMATVRRCDVYPKEIEGVKRYRLSVVEIGSDPEEPTEIVHELTADLCERALDRATALLDRAIAPPKKREKKSDDRA